MSTVRRPRGSALARLQQGLTVGLACTLLGHTVFANPTGAQIVAGQVTMSGSGNTLSITNSPGSIINWSNFSINPGQLTRFVQQNASSSVLNRVSGGDPSLILGALQSNGRVFLINPNGVLFGAGATVNVNGLIASSLNLSNGDFLNKTFNFTAGTTSAGVKNQGAITTPSGGQVYLIAPTVENDGVISTPHGEVLLAAGHRISLGDSSNPEVTVTVSAPADTVLNLGRIVSASGQIGIYGALVMNQGTVSANSAVAGQSGHIVLRASGLATLGSQSLTSADGAGEGGRVEVTGDHVALLGGAQIQANGETGGGIVLVGGGEHGADPALGNAAMTYVSPGASISANAGQSGNGGQVIVWSEVQTQMYGQLAARGGARSGNGGAVEVSSRGSLDFQGLADLRAPHGFDGTLLLDPTDIVIYDGPSSGDVSVSSAPFTISATGTTSYLSSAQLEAQLAVGNVTVTTASSQTAAPSNGTITVQAPVAWQSTRVLALNADQDIVINAPISTAAGSLALLASQGSISEGPNGAISAPGLSATANLGSVTLGGANLAGTFTAYGLQGVSFNDNRAVTLQAVGSTGPINVSAAGSIRIAGLVNAASSAVTLSSTGAILEADGSVSGSSLNASAATGVGSLAQPLQTSVGSWQVLNTTSGDIALSNTGQAVQVADLMNSGYGIAQEASGSIYLTANNALSVAAPITITGSGNIALVAAGALSLPGQISAPTGVVALQSTGGDISQQGLGSISAAAVNAQARNGEVDLTGPDNTVGRIAGLSNSSNGFDFFDDGPGFTVGSVGAVGTIPAATGVTATNTAGFGVNLQENGTGGLLIAAPISVDNANGAYLAAPSGGIAQGNGGSITAGSLILIAGNAGIGSAAAPLLTNVSNLNSSSSQADAYLSNASSLTIQQLDATGTVGVYSGGSLQTATAAFCGDCLRSIAGTNVTLNAAGSVLVSAGSSVTASNVLNVNAGYDPISSTYPNAAGSITNNGSVTAATINLNASSTVGGTGIATGTTFISANLYQPALSACIANPSLAGCASVLPTLTQCTSTPSLAGCGAVLPTLATCTANPATAGCVAVLPSLAGCTNAPATPGCSAVLPSLSACTTAPTLQGCSAVLPSVGACTVAPATAGCSAVLPSLAACTSAPATSGCSAVLPSAAVCSAAPSTAGCAAPPPPTLAQCSASPTLAGCSAVLPSLAACETNTAAAGCNVVLPSLMACTATPSLAGCAGVLPSLATCGAAPTTAGCMAVLPSVASCISSPAATGCSAVLPTVAQCAATPATYGCIAVIAPAISTALNAPTVVASGEITVVDSSAVSTACGADTSPSPSSPSSAASSTSGSSNNSSSTSNAKKLYCN